ncbi:MAG: TM2 domain-containing protein [Solobacterium sp.]|nr:TM2 domain-containing protein [Solobacterium sp.]
MSETRTVKIECPNCKKRIAVQEGRMSLLCPECHQRIKVTKEMFENSFEEQAEERQVEEITENLKSQVTNNWDQLSTIWWYIAIGTYLFGMFANGARRGFLIPLLMFIIIVGGGLALYFLRPEKLEVRPSGATSFTKKKSVALLLCIAFGFAGAHYIYVGRKATGILYAATGGLFMLGVLKDIYLIMTGNFFDAEGNRLA